VKQIFNPEGVPRLPFFSPVVRAGDFVFVSGTAGLLPDHAPSGEGAEWSPGKLAEGGIKAETRQALDNIKAALEAAGASLSDVVKVNSYLRDVDLYFHDYNEVYMEYFPEERPTRTTVGAKIYGSILIEIDCVAYVPAR
jgi:enamine deaminase RidA (YjgF/YER057c/UK114 family)